ncbi:MAG: DUF6263 family protein, partial [Limisphaerales bacterium]
MIAHTANVRRLKLPRLSLLLVLCATLLPLAACKKKEDAAAASGAGAAPADGAPAEAAPKEEPPVEFKAAWPVGQRLVQRVETITDTEGQNPVNQQPFKLANTQVQELAFTALKARESGGHEVEVETLAVTTTNKIGTNTTVFTSRSDPKQDAKNNPLAAPMRKLVGGKVKLLTTADGKVEKVEGGPQLRSKVTAGANMYVIASLNNMLSDEAIKGWNTLHTGLPDAAVKPGDSWPFTRNQSFGPGTITMDATNTFKGWEQRDGRKVALIESVGVIVAKPPAGNSPVTVTVEDGATTSGKAWFDPALGCIVESTATSDFSIRLAFASGQSTASKAKVVATAKLTDAPNPGATAAEAAPSAPAAAK